MEGWKLGLKAVAIYRDGSKLLQPVKTNEHTDDSKEEFKKPVVAAIAKPYRRRLPETRKSITHKFSVAGHEGYLTVGLYDDGQPGELFITMAKEGSTVGGLMDVVGTCVSMSLQYGVPLITLVEKFRHARFEPSGMTSNKNIPFAKSLIDYIFCWMGCQFIPGYAEKNTPNRGDSAPTQTTTVTAAKQIVEKTQDLAKKIDQARSIRKNNPQQPEKGGNGDNPAASGTAKALSSRFTGEMTAERVADLVNSILGSDTPGTDAVVMQQFNAQFDHFQDDAPACDICGSITVRNGACYKCFNCGNSMGCS
jgi:ribonucleoside-diphosphate reductase alpha chain